MGLSIEERYEDFLNACLNSDYELVEDIIFDRTFRININRSLKDGANALVIAVQQNDYQLVKLLQCFSNSCTAKRLSTCKTFTA